MSNIHHAGLQRWLLITVVPLLRQQEALHVCVYSAGTHGGIYPQTGSGMGSQRDWIWLFTKQGGDTLLFGLNLSLTPRCPLRLRDAICFLFFLPKEGRQAPLPLRCNLWSEKNKSHESRAPAVHCGHLTPPTVFR